MPQSQQQVALARLVLQGKAKNSTMTKSAAQEIVDGMAGRSMGDLPKKVNNPNQSSRYGTSKTYKMGLKALAALLFIIGVAKSQPNVQPVSVTDYPPRGAPTTLISYSGSNVTYICYASPDQPTLTWPVSGINPPGSASIVVLTNVGTVTTTNAHGLQVGNKVTLSGSATTALNGSYIIQTTPSSPSLTDTTFTITTSGVSNATYNNFSMSTNAPRSTAGIWSVKAIRYSGSNITNPQWALGASGNYINICANQATLEYK